MDAWLSIELLDKQLNRQRRLSVDATDKAKLKDASQNIIAVKVWKDNKLYKKVVEIFQSDEMLRRLKS